MRKSYLFYKLVFAGVLMAITTQSCKKENGIDNNTVIKRPYGLYVADMDGQLLNTTDGENFITMFPADGFASRSVITSGENVLWHKANLHLSENEGRNFNPTFNFIPSYVVDPPKFNPWQPIMLDVPSHGRVYVSSSLGHGISYSIDNGRTWDMDTAWDDRVMIGHQEIGSLALMADGRLYAHSLSSNNLYMRMNKDVNWLRIIDRLGNNTLPVTGALYLTAYNNTLVATDMNGVNGVLYSHDLGGTWFNYGGLPAGIKIYSTHAPFGQHLLVGLDSLGVYRLENGTFVPSNNGLGEYTTVYSIVGKGNIFKNEAVRNYVYAATNKGLFRSEDFGRNWTLMKPGNYVNVH